MNRPPENRPRSLGAMAFLRRPLKWRARDKVAGVALLAAAGVSIAALVWPVVGSGGPHRDGFTITGAVSTDITWDKDLPPDCNVWGADDGAKSFFFDATVGGGTTRLLASIRPFRGPASYDAIAASENGNYTIGWYPTGVTAFTLGNERWQATNGSFIVAS